MKKVIISSITNNNSHKSYDKTIFIKNDLSHYNVSSLLKNTIIQELTSFYKNKVNINTVIIDYSNINAYSMVPENVIPVSLDDNIVSPYYAHVSRVFTNDEQYEPINRIINISDNIKELKNKEVMLVDDDSMTGGNLLRVKNELEKMGVIVLPEARLVFNTNPLDDVIDASDFLPYNGAGLVMKINNMITRVPYYPPLVNPVTRASCPVYLLNDYMKMITNIKEAA